MAVQLIRNLSANDLAPGVTNFSFPAEDAPSSQTEQPRQEPDTPLLLREEPPAKDVQAKAPEFHTIRLDAAEPAPVKNRPQWLLDIERLEASARQAMDTLTNGQDARKAPVDTGTMHTPSRLSESELLPEVMSPLENLPAEPLVDARPSGAQGPQMRETAEPPAAAAAVNPDSGADDFSPRFVANADIRPEDGEPGAENGRSIRENMDINRRAIEQAAADGTARHGQHDAVSHDYLAMEDRAIDRLLETTNALLENDDHTRKNQSLDRLKAAVVATEAERRISVKTATGTVTLDFDEKGSTRRPVAELLAAPKVDPEKRRQRLQDYRKMIAEHKKRP